MIVSGFSFSFLFFSFLLSLSMGIREFSRLSTKFAFSIGSGVPISSLLLLPDGAKGPVFALKRERNFIQGEVPKFVYIEVQLEFSREAQPYVVDDLGIRDSRTG